MPLFLAGGSEFSPCMTAPDRRLISLAGGLASPIRIIPTAAAPDNNQERAGGNGVRWFKELGGKDVGITYVIDSQSANDPTLADSLLTARLIYLLGGFPGYLANTLRNSLAWKSMLQAWHDGAVIAGSSAGAMVLCDHCYDPYEKKFFEGLGLLQNAFVIPHHAVTAKRWLPLLREQYPKALFIGIDECAGILRETPDPNSTWTVLGEGTVTLYPPVGSSQIYKPSQSFQILEGTSPVTSAR